MPHVSDDSVVSGLHTATPRRTVLKGAGGLALGVLGLGDHTGGGSDVAAAPRAEATPMPGRTAERPNIVVIMSDDVGWGDLGCYGGGPMRGAPTPHLDRLAAEGMRFVNYYGQASCTAGRASFITGRIPIRTALSLVLLPGDPDHLTPETPTVAQFMSEQGYTTVQIGKWHLGDVDEAYPIANGFDEMYHMLPYYAGVYAYPDTNLTPDWPADNPEFMKAWNSFNLGEWEGKKGEPATKTRDFTWQDLATVDTDMRKTAITWLQDHAHDDEPFFMYLNFMKVHNPNFPSQEWEGKSPGKHPYLDSLMELDDNSGQVVQALRDLGIAEDTLVIWTTDNGAWVDAWPDAGYTPFRGEKGSAYEGGFRVPAIAWWPGTIAPGQVATEMMSHMDWWPTFAGLIGVEPPPHIWQDNNGEPIVFDGIDNSAYLLGEGPSARDSFFFYYDQAFGGLRVDNYKFLFTAKDTWLGPSLPLTSAPAMYNLLWDPGEQFDSLFNGAMPNAGQVQTSPGRFSGADHGWTLSMFMTPVLTQHLEELAKYPNKPSLIGGGPYYQIPPENRPG
ncbi:MAG: arylsulfatase [Thermomicrobiales bacterium]|nr:arylsulfatase [Thermomicrobiales bacterium]